MSKKVNYVADLLFLQANLNTLISSLRRPVDPDLFADHLDGQIHFAATTLGRLHRALQESSFSAGRLRVLLELRSLAVLILDLLDLVLHGTSPIAGALVSQVPRYMRMRTSIRETLRDLSHEIQKTSRGSEDEGPIVTEEELLHLLAEAE